MVGGAAGTQTSQRPVKVAGWTPAVPRTNRGVLRGLLGACLALTVVFGVVGGVAIASRSSATNQFAAQAEPLAVDLQQLYTALDDADATAAAAYLSGSVIGTALRDEYDSDIARAESSLASAQRAVGGGNDAVSAQLAVIAAQIPVYTALVATAQADNRLVSTPQPIGTAYLREASTLMRSTLLPDTLAAYRAELSTVSTIKAGATGVPWLLTFWLVITLALLVAAQRQIARRTHRVFNPGLLAATGVLAVATVWTLAALGAHRSDLDNARDQATRVQTLATVADAAIQAHADEALMLIAHGSDNGAYADDFTAQLKTATTALQSGGAGTSTSKLADVAAHLLGWSKADGQVRSAVTAGDYRSAVATALGTGSTDAAGIADNLNAEMTNSQHAFADDSNSAASALDGLLAGLVAAGILAAAAAGYGVNRRLAEYR